MVLQTQGTRNVVIENLALPVKIGQPFEIDFTVCSDGSDQIERLTIDAIMPAHKHGMNYQPYITEVEGDHKYRANGLFFHMPGEWRITIDVFGAASSEQFAVDVKAE
jgi:hypothetical protein